MTLIIIHMVMKLQFKPGLCVAAFISYSNYLAISPLERAKKKKKQIEQIGGGREN